MARRRMIDPAMWQSEDFSRCSFLARLIFVGLISQADDEGRGKASPAYIKSTLFPYEDGIRLIDIEKALSEIGQHLSVTYYSTIDGKQYYSLDSWMDWQTLDKPKPSKFPAPPEKNEVADESPTNPRQIADESPTNPRQIPPEGALRGIGSRNRNNIPPISPNGDIAPLEGGSPRKHKYGEYKNVLLTDDELNKLKADYADYLDRIERLSSYIASTGKAYKSHYATIRNWARADAAQQKTQRPNRQRDFGNSRVYSAAELDRMGHDLLGGD